MPARLGRHAERASHAVRTYTAAMPLYRRRARFSWHGHRQAIFFRLRDISYYRHTCACRRRQAFRAERAVIFARAFLRCLHLITADEAVLLACCRHVFPCRH